MVSEAGKLVNLADWFGAFEVALEDTEKDDEAMVIESNLRKKQRKEASTTRNGSSRSGSQNQRVANGHQDGFDGVEEEDSEDEETTRIRSHQARFLAAAADLAYLGYVQPTKRKVEHVARVVF